MPADHQPIFGVQMQEQASSRTAGHHGGAAFMDVCLLVFTSAHLAQGDEVVAGHRVVLAAVHHDELPLPRGRADLDLAALCMR